MSKIHLGDGEEIEKGIEDQIHYTKLLEENIQIQIPWKLNQGKNILFLSNNCEKWKLLVMCNNRSSRVISVLFLVDLEGALKEGTLMEAL